MLTTIGVSLPEGYVGSIGTQANAIISDLSGLAFMVVGVVLGLYLITKTISLVTKHVRA